MMVTRRGVLLGSAGVLALGASGLAGRRAWFDREAPLLPATNDKGHMLWSNWSGRIHAYPAVRSAPATDAEVAELVRSGPAPIRPVGAGHSFTELVPTDGTLMTLDRMTGLIASDPVKRTARFKAGTRLADVGAALAKVGQAMPNLPDINKQTLAGAIATATHGTGKGLPAIHGRVTELRIVTPQGEIVDCSRSERPELFDAARVGLGAFGVITEVALQNEALTRVKKVASVVDTETVLNDWPGLITKHRSVEMMIVPFTGKSLLVTVNDTQEPLQPRGPDRDNGKVLELKRLRDAFEFMPSLRTKIAYGFLDGSPDAVAVDESWKLLSNERAVKFNEMEYHLPIERQLEVLRDIIGHIERNNTDVFFPIEVRIIAEDDAWLSPFYQRETGSIAVHAYYKDDYQWLFKDIEPRLRDAGGRPHWGKLHSLTAPELGKLYPMYAEAARLRRTLDPQGRMLNPYLAKLFEDG